MRRLQDKDTSSPEDYAHRPVSQFISGFVLRTTEGKLFLAGSLLCVTWGLLLWLAPSALPAPPRGTRFDVVAGFLIMPLVLLAVLFKFADPDYQPSLLTSAMLLVTICLPFYWAYLR